MSILAARATPPAAGPGSSAPDQRGGAMIYLALGAWHAACDSPLATVLRRLPRVKQKDIAMQTSIAAVAQRPFARHLLAATAALALSLAAGPPAQAPDPPKHRTPPSPPRP